MTAQRHRQVGGHAGLLGRGQVLHVGDHGAPGVRDPRRQLAGAHRVTAVGADGLGGGGQERVVVLLRGGLADRDVRLPLLGQQHRCQVVADEALQHAEQGGDRLLQAARGRRDGGDRLRDGALEQLAVQQVADAREHVLLGQLERVGLERRSPTAGRGRRCQHLVDGRGQLAGLEVLGEVAVDTRLPGPVPVAGGVQGRQHHDRDVRGLPVVLEQARGDEAGHPRHLHVEHDRVGLVQEHQLDGADPVLRGQHLMALPGQHAGDDASQRRAVIGDHDLGHGPVLCSSACGTTCLQVVGRWRPAAPGRSRSSAGTPSTRPRDRPAGRGPRPARS